MDATETPSVGAPDSERTRCTNRVEPTGTVDLLMTTVPGRSTGAISRATASTNDMSAAPSSPSGVGTHRKMNSAIARRGRRTDDELEAPARDAGLGDELGQSVLEDRDLTLAQPSDAIGVDVGTRHVVTEVSQAGRGRETRRSRHPSLQRSCESLPSLRSQAGRSRARERQTVCAGRCRGRPIARAPSAFRRARHYRAPPLHD